VKHWRHHPDDETLEITVEALVNGEQMFQTIIQQVKEAIMAALEEASAEAVSVDAALVAYVQQLQAELAAAQVPDPNAQAAIDALVTATAGVKTLLPVVTPTVTGLSPATGGVAGGESVVITGTGLTGTTAVDFGGVAATSFSVDSDTQITAVAPASATGTVDVTVTAPAGTSTAVTADQFTSA
jgi:hypothetical protein